MAKLVEKESRMAISRGKGDRDCGLVDIEFPLCKIKTFQRMVS